MGILGLVAILLPQMLLLLLFGSYFDLLGGWNHTDAAMGALMGLFVAAPVLAAIWLVALAISNWLRRAQSRPRQPLWPAAAVLVQALFIDLVIVSQAHM